MQAKSAATTQREIKGPLALNADFNDPRHDTQTLTHTPLSIFALSTGDPSLPFHILCSYLLNLRYFISFFSSRLANTPFSFLSHCSSQTRLASNSSFFGEAS